MPYSIRGTGASVALALADLSAKLDDVVAGQPVHAKDRDQALAAARNFADIVGEPNTAQNMVINLNGSLSWVGAGDPDITAASVSVSASFAVR